MPFDKSHTALVRRARTINRILAATYPDAHIELDFTNPLELLVATILSAQSTDKRVNLVTPVVFARYHPGLMPEIRARFPERQLWLYILGGKAPDLLGPYESSGLPALETETVRPQGNFDGFTVSLAR